MSPALGISTRRCSSTMGMYERMAAYKKAIPESQALKGKARVEPANRINWFAPNLMLLRATGFWYHARDGAPSMLGWLQALYMYIIVACNVIFCTTKAMHTVLEKFSISAITENLVDLLCITFSLSQLFVLLAIKEKVLTLTKKTEAVLCHVFNEADADLRKGLLQRQASSHKSSYVLFACFLLCGLNFAIIVSVTGNKTHALPIPIWTPFPQNESPTLEFLLLVECMGVILTVAGAGALSAHFYSFVRAMSASFKVVQNTFRSQRERTSCVPCAWSELEKYTALQNLKRTIRLHQTVLDLSDEICLVLEPFFSCQLATIGFMICIGLFQVSVDPSDLRNIRFIALIMNVVTQSFTICYQGTNLSEEAKAVQDGVDTGNFYFQGSDLGYAIRFIMMRAQKPPYIKVAKNVNVHLPTFVEMMRTSYSFFAFLQKRAGKEKQ